MTCHSCNLPDGFAGCGSIFARQKVAEGKFSVSLFCRAKIEPQPEIHPGRLQE